MIDFTNLVGLKVFVPLQVTLAIDLLSKLTQLFCDLINNAPLRAILLHILHVDFLVQLLLHIELICFHVDRLESVVL